LLSLRLLEPLPTLFQPFQRSFFAQQLDDDPHLRADLHPHRHQRKRTTVAARQ
jgi:hypothetical protein